MHVYFGICIKNRSFNEIVLHKYIQCIQFLVYIPITILWEDI